MPIKLFSNDEDLDSKEKAKATYSTFRTGILSLTPGDQKCRLYCKGQKCPFCIVESGKPTIQAIDGLYSTWITPKILAMGRLQEDHFDKYDIVEKFKINDIKSVINLQEIGEHSYCGNGNLRCGFSYDPEKLMQDGIYHYNFPLPDFEACTSHRLLDIVKVVDFALTIGKIAVHCHAGHGRTGMVIAAWMMYSSGLSPHEAVKLVRSQRAKAVQSREQVETLHNFKLLIQNNGGMIIPRHKFLTISDYITYNQTFLSRPESRLYGQIPKVVYVIMNMVLNQCFEVVIFDIKLSDGIDKLYQLEVECSSPRSATYSLDEELLNCQLNEDNLDRTLMWYQKMVKEGLAISTMHKFFENEDFRDLIRFLDLFFHSTFHQLTYKEKIIPVLEIGPTSCEKRENCWSPTFWFCLKCIKSMPAPLHFAFSRLLSKWFIRSTTDLPQKFRKYFDTT